MKKYLLIVLLIAGLDASAQFLYPNYTVNNTGYCDYEVTFVQTGFVKGGQSCITQDTQVITAGSSFTWNSGDYWCNITEVSFTVRAVGNSTSHQNLLNSSEDFEDGACSGQYNHVTFWQPLNGYTFNVFDDIITGVNPPWKN